MFKAILKKAAPLPRLSALQSFLFVGPHPDDIEVACAPTVARLAAAGARIRFVIVTDGSGGAVDPALSGEALTALRRREATASAGLLGVNDIVFLPFVDGGEESEREIADALCREILRFRPDAVFAPDPDVPSECHPDHLRVGRAAKAAFLRVPHRNLMARLSPDAPFEPKALALYYTDRVNQRVPIRTTYALRERALRCHGSQFTDEMLRALLPYFLLRSVRLGLARLTLADGYRVLSPLRAHCMPEASRL